MALGGILPLSNIIDIAKKLLELLGKLAEFSKKNPLLAGTLATIAAFALGYYLGNTTPVPNHPLGGLDLGRYCKSYNYESNTDQLCFSRIELAKACDWQYGSSDLTFRYLSDSAFSGQCYTSRGKDLGGINDMPGYCKQAFMFSADVHAHAPADSSKPWQCQTNISPKLACAWQYQKYKVIARKNETLWNCYD